MEKVARLCISPPTDESYVSESLWKAQMSHGEPVSQLEQR